MSFAAMLAKSGFPDEPLDSRDRKLVQVIYQGGAKGIGFNELVERARGFASRSTVAVRMHRLVKLGYLERNGGRGLRKEKPVRVTFKCYTLMMSIDKTKEVTAKLHSQMQSMRESGSIGEEEAKRWWAEFRERYNTFFGMVGTIAVFYGHLGSGGLVPAAHRRGLQVALDGVHGDGQGEAGAFEVSERYHRREGDQQGDQPR